jgi:hypothetical protein
MLRKKSCTIVGQGFDIHHPQPCVILSESDPAKRERASRRIPSMFAPRCNIKAFSRSSFRDGSSAPNPRQVETEFS